MLYKATRAAAAFDVNDRRIPSLVVVAAIPTRFIHCRFEAISNAQWTRNLSEISTTAFFQHNQIPGLTPG